MQTLQKSTTCPRGFADARVPRAERRGGVELRGRALEVVAQAAVREEREAALEARRRGRVAQVVEPVALHLDVRAVVLAKRPVVVDDVADASQEAGRRGL